MSEQSNHQRTAESFTRRTGTLARAARVRTAAKRVLHSLDQVDYLIRHWLTPVTLEQGERSIPDQKNLIPHSGLPPDIQNAIGRGLRAVYPPDPSMPLRLVILLKEFEQRANQAEAIRARAA
jgi:hypothetical protein